MGPFERMAKCDQGYLCEICGNEVENITDSSLYLQYVIGWIAPETLHSRPDSHLRCNPALAQFIDSEDFLPPVVHEGAFDRRTLDAEFSNRRTALVTEGFLRLCELTCMRHAMTLTEYPLPEVIQSWNAGSEEPI